MNVSTPTSRRATDRHEVRVTPLEVDGRHGHSPLHELIDDWQRLADGAPLPTSAPAWVLACAEAFHPDRTVRLVHVHRDGRLVAACALVDSHDGRMLELPGVDAFYEPTDVNAVDPAALACLASALTRLRRPVVLGRLPADGPTPAALRAAGRGRGLATFGSAPGAPRITLEEGWCEPETQLRSRRRSDLRRARRRAQALGSTRFESTLPGIGELEALLEEALRVEASGWKGRTGSALAVDGAQRHALATFARHAASRRRLRVSFLRIGEQTAAMQIAVEHADAVWVLKTGYDEQFARCSPGMLVTAETIAHAARRGLGAFELQGCPEPWTQAFTTDERPTVAARFYPARPLALASWARRRSRVLQRRLTAERGR